MISAMLHSVLIAGHWRKAQSTGTFTAENPAAGEKLPDEYPISDWADCDAALDAAAEAAALLRTTPPERLARFLEAYAGRIEARKAELVEMAHAETGLPRTPRLADVELPRTTGQLRQGASAVREGSWALPTIDTKLNIRSALAPIGPVLVFGPNNFPFAFNSVAGGDFVAALAAGNPVIAKANSSHPGTTRLLAEEALRGGDRCRPAARQRAADLPHQPQRWRAARLRPARRRNGLHRQPFGRTEAEGGRRRCRQADLPRAVGREPRGDAAGSARRARRSPRRRVRRQQPDGDRPVLHEPEPGLARRRGCDGAVRRRREGALRGGGADSATLVRGGARAALERRNAPGGGGARRHGRHRRSGRRLPVLQHAAARLGRRVPRRTGEAADRGLRQRGALRRRARRRAGGPP